MLCQSRRRRHGREAASHPPNEQTFPMLPSDPMIVRPQLPNPIERADEC